MNIAFAGRKFGIEILVRNHLSISFSQDPPTDNSTVGWIKIKPKGEKNMALILTFFGVEIKFYIIKI